MHFFLLWNKRGEFGPNSFDIQKKFIQVWNDMKMSPDSVDRNALQLTRITQSDYIFQATILQDDIRVTLSNKASFSHLLTELSCPGVGSKRRGVVCTASTCYCSSSLNVNIYFFSWTKQIQYSSEWATQSCNMLNNTNILYVFNPILLTVFAADLGCPILILLNKTYFFHIFFFIAEVLNIFLHPVERFELL